ncbi:hypothetical protein GCM10007207_12400 [Asaia siamensis]|uniref:Uncharacterized protein n=1 Tax=Asaia siamensis TaxID=110479 RepID=A0ABQ1LR55_9PROT|nr:hypothetical protein AA0323_0630 [Asaia siamensis NRIC 0323]GGC28466.1 hypothetical protein GCM10007207_12400 [Asaia siamensis]
MDAMRMAPSGYLHPKHAMEKIVERINGYHGYKVCNAKAESVSRNLKSGITF